MLYYRQPLLNLTLWSFDRNLCTAEDVESETQNWKSALKCRQIWLLNLQIAERHNYNVQSVRRLLQRTAGSQWRVQNHVKTGPLMYSSNHLVRDCSILNLHIIITQSLLPNQSKHMDMFLRELRVYYAGRLVRTWHTHTHTRTQAESFPRLNKC